LAIGTPTVFEGPFALHALAVLQLRSCLNPLALFSPLKWTSTPEPSPIRDAPYLKKEASLAFSKQTKKNFILIPKYLLS